MAEKAPNACDINGILTPTKVDLALWHQLSCPAQAGYWAERHSAAEFIPRSQQMKFLKLTRIPQPSPGHSLRLIERGELSECECELVCMA